MCFNRPLSYCKWPLKGGLCSNCSNEFREIVNDTFSSFPGAHFFSSLFNKYFTCIPSFTYQSLNLIVLIMSAKSLCHLHCIAIEQKPTRLSPQYPCQKITQEENNFKWHFTEKSRNSRLIQIVALLWGRDKAVPHWMICIQSSKEASVLLPVTIQPNPNLPALFLKVSHMKLPWVSIFSHFRANDGYCGLPSQYGSTSGSQPVISSQSLHNSLSLEPSDVSCHNKTPGCSLKNSLIITYFFKKLAII